MAITVTRAALAFLLVLQAVQPAQAQVTECTADIPGAEVREARKVYPGAYGRSLNY